MFERPVGLVCSFVDVDAVEREAGAERVHHRVVGVDDGGDAGDQADFSSPVQGAPAVDTDVAPRSCGRRSSTRRPPARRCRSSRASSASPAPASTRCSSARTSRGGATHRLPTTRPGLARHRGRRAGASPRRPGAVPVDPPRHHACAPSEHDGFAFPVRPPARQPVRLDAPFRAVEGDKVGVRVAVRQSDNSERAHQLADGRAAMHLRQQRRPARRRHAAPERRRRTDRRVEDVRPVLEQESEPLQLRRRQLRRCGC